MVRENLTQKDNTWTKTWKKKKIGEKALKISVVTKGNRRNNGPLVETCQSCWSQRKQVEPMQSDRWEKHWKMRSEKWGQGPVGQLGYNKDSHFSSECNEKPLEGLEHRCLSWLTYQKKKKKNIYHTEFFCEDQMQCKNCKIQIILILSLTYYVSFYTRQLCQTPLLHKIVNTKKQPSPLLLLYI